MGTALSVVYDTFTTLVRDYRLVELYESSVVDFETYLESWLIFAIRDFRNCNQSLAYSSGSFSETLTSTNITMLAQMMKKYWLEKEVHNITQMNLHVQDRDFKVYAEANNLNAKQAALAQTKEEISQLLVDYGISNLPMDDWLAGNFYVG